MQTARSHQTLMGLKAAKHCVKSRSHSLKSTNQEKSGKRSVTLRPFFTKVFVAAQCPGSGPHLKSSCLVFGSVVGKGIKPCAGSPQNCSALATFICCKKPDLCIKCNGIKGRAPMQSRNCKVISCAVFISVCKILSKYYLHNVTAKGKDQS